MDEEEKEKANPNIVIILDYLAAGVLLFALWYPAFILKAIDATLVTTTFIGALTALGIYKSSSKS
jgi:hypothetical protein